MWTITCPTCAKILRQPEEGGDRAFQCPACGIVFDASGQVLENTSDSEAEQSLVGDDSPAEEEFQRSSAIRQGNSPICLLDDADKEFAKDLRIFCFAGGTGIGCYFLFALSTFENLDKFLTNLIMAPIMGLCVGIVSVAVAVAMRRRDEANDPARRRKKVIGWSTFALVSTVITYLSLKHTVSGDWIMAPFLSLLIGGVFAFLAVTLYDALAVLHAVPKNVVAASRLEEDSDTPKSESEVPETAIHDEDPE